MGNWKAGCGIIYRSYHSDIWQNRTQRAETQFSDNNTMNEDWREAQKCKERQKEGKKEKKKRNNVLSRGPWDNVSVVSDH